jgi:hypothetical protein
MVMERASCASTAPEAGTMAMAAMAAAKTNFFITELAFIG